MNEHGDIRHLDPLSMPHLNEVLLGPKEAEQLIKESKGYRKAIYEKIKNAPIAGDLKRLKRVGKYRR